MRKATLLSLGTLFLALVMSGCGTPAAPVATALPATSGPASDAPALPTETPLPPTPIPPPEAPEPTSGPIVIAPAGDGLVQGWAVLADKEDYKDVDMTPLPVGYIGLTQMRQVLEEGGWPADHIQELREFDRETLVEGLDWLEEQADQDDVVFLYVAGHGRYLRDVLVWAEFFAGEWAEIPSHRRLLVIDSCQAANYTGVVAGDPAPYLSVAAVAGDEYGWSGLEEEGLPIIGGVFTHYFAAAFSDSAADADGNGFVSVQEAALLAEGQQRTYMHEVVFAVPEFVESYHDIGVYPDQDPTFPNVIVDDTIGQPLYLDLEAYGSTEEAAVGEVAPVVFTILYDNYAHNLALQTDWGFACLIETGEMTVLFDTGANGRVLLDNMEALGVDPLEIDALVFSHTHGDHTEGLTLLLRTGVEPVVYIPTEFPEDFKESLYARVDEVVEVEGPTEILPGFYSTGGMGRGLIEQALAVETPAGLVVVTGCAHPGVVNLVRQAKEFIGGEIALVMGGFHLGGALQSEIERIIDDLRELGVPRVAPTHCTGDEARQMFARAYAEDCLLVGVGQIIRVEVE